MLPINMGMDKFRYTWLTYPSLEGASIRFDKPWKSINTMKIVSFSLAHFRQGVNPIAPGAVPIRSGSDL